MAVVLRSRAGGQSLGDMVAQQERNRATTKSTAGRAHPGNGKAKGENRGGAGKGAKDGH
jgi:hypothetical protein